MKGSVTLLKGAIGVALFFAIWFGLSQLNWLDIFRIKEATQTAEEKIGQSVWEMQRARAEEVLDTAIIAPLDSLLSRICKANYINRDDIKLHVLQTDEVNAYALPDGHLVIFSGLIDYSENQDELAGVIGHELAHVEENHVMKKLIKEVGLAAVISTTTGSSNLGEIFRVLTSSAYDRTLESDADAKAVEYLKNADIDPTQLAHFLYRLAEEEGAINQQLEWVSSHPLSMERAKAIVEECEKLEMVQNPVLTQNRWENLKQNIQNLDNSENL